MPRGVSSRAVHAPYDLASLLPIGLLIGPHCRVCITGMSAREACSNARDTTQVCFYASLPFIVRPRLSGLSSCGDFRT